MALETVFAQITHEASSPSKAEASMLPVCCRCGLIRDQTRVSLDCERWVTRRAYLKTHGVNSANCVLAHTYCPSCFTKVMETTRRHELESR
jgi:hypothetical protein